MSGLPNNKDRILATKKETGEPIPIVEASRLIFRPEEPIPWEYVKVEQFEFDPSEYTSIILRQPLIGMLISDMPVRTQVKRDGIETDLVFTKGDHSLYPPGPTAPFKLLNSGQSFIASFETRLFDEIIEDAGISEFDLLPVAKSSDPFLTASMFALKDEMERGCPSGRMYGDSIATALAAHLIGRYTAAKTDEIVARGGLNSNAIRIVIEYIKSNHQKDLSLGELASIVYMSPYHFSRLFKQSTGLTPYQYLLNCRINRAMELLATGQHTVKQAAHLVGFNDQSHFTRQFKRIAGVSPIVYMQTRR